MKFFVTGFCTLLSCGCVTHLYIKSTVDSGQPIVDPNPEVCDARDDAKWYGAGLI